MNRIQVIFGICIILVLAVSAIWQFFGRTAMPEPSSPAVLKPPTMESNVPAMLDIHEVSVTSADRPVQTSFAMAEGDSITSWDFKGAYTDNPELAAKAQNEISRLSGLLAATTSSAMILSVGIANQYELLGNGARQYEYLVRAIQTGTADGLPWHNLGVLLERLGAMETARIAYREATFLQPSFKQWHYAYLEFLTTRMKNDAADIEKAFAAAEKNLGPDSDILQLRSEWEDLNA